ncbi:helix-turn-helix domain-containing protein [Prevotella sp. E13-27]|uniref:helix-turn-helix domain-containing protein n=1 Tax=Prevotella sp. E13-27 TaxID=2938122 RepID=UPI00200A53A8|nr:helix-turn-helix domain-containing protein [Prevotella sp. E13-27]MCK8621542.1 helix-turn-helix domain-containing protein [Prevotella sp. E13-27]
MMRVFRYILGVLVLVGMAALTACEGKNEQSQDDIPKKKTRTRGDSIALAARFTGDFEHFLAVTDSLANKGELSPIRAGGYRGVAYFQLGQIDKCIECFRKVIANDPPAEDFWEYIHAGTNLVIILNSQRDYDTAMRTALRLIDMLKQVDSPVRAGEMQTLYLCLGDTQMMLERHEEAKASYDEAYKWVLQTPNDSTCRPLAASFETLENIAVTHINHHLDEAGVWVDRMDSLCVIYEKQPKAIEREKKAFQALVYLHRAQVCQMRGQEKDAARYYAEYMKTDYGQSLEGRINGCDYLVEARRYNEAADNYTQLDRFIKEWGYDYDLETIGNNLLPKLRSNYYADRKDSALRVALQIAEVYDSALIRQKRSESAELATIYDTQGKERQIAEEHARNRLFSAISTSTGILALLIMVFAIYMLRQWRFTKEKNRILAQQITEAVEYKKKYRELKQSQAQILPETEEFNQAEDGNKTEGITTPLPSEEAGGGSAVIISDITDLNDEQMFLCLRDIIENEQLFLQSDFGRQTLIDHTGLSKERIGAAFSQGGENISLPQYIRELRLDYAIHLMNDQPELNIEMVSQASGFTSADTFTRNFRAKYGMTPTAYKQTKA